MAQVNKEEFGPSEWLELLMRCQNGEATCMRVIERINEQTVPIRCVEDMRANMLQLCYAIERMPAGTEQTDLSIRASAIAQEMQRLVLFHVVA